MPVNGIELKAGQKWKTESGYEGILKDGQHSVYCFKMEGGSERTYTRDGEVFIDCSDEDDLEELIQDTPTQGQTFTLHQLHCTLTALDYEGIYEHVATYLTNHSDPEYSEYIRLKEKFKGDDE